MDDNPRMVRYNFHSIFPYVQPFPSIMKLRPDHIYRVIREWPTDQQGSFPEEKGDLRSPGKKLESIFWFLDSKTIFEIQERYWSFKMKHFDLQ